MRKAPREVGGADGGIVHRGQVTGSAVANAVPTLTVKPTVLLLNVSLTRDTQDLFHHFAVTCRVPRKAVLRVQR